MTPRFAEDLISGVNRLDPEKCIRQFKPQDLPLFNLVLLADVVHDKAPSILYSRTSATGLRISFLK